MRAKRAMMILAILVLILTCTTQTVSAGVEPSPFRSDEGKLEAVINNLESIRRRVEDTLIVSPDSVGPGTANKLGAMNNELLTLYKRLDYMHLKRNIDSGQIQGSYIEAHEVGHSFLSFVDEYVDGGFEDMNINMELRHMRATLVLILNLLDSHIRPD